jgi:hypothetical protein
MRSQSPADSLYHDDSDWEFEIGVLDENRTFTWNTTAQLDRKDMSAMVVKHDILGDVKRYQYASISTAEFRLLRISPGPFGSDLRCSLKVVSLAKIKIAVLEFQALSYAWGTNNPDCVILLDDIPKIDASSSAVDTKEPGACLVRGSLFHALKGFHQTDFYSWLWVDALCINQVNENEKSQQIPKMPDIYSNVWNVIAWLGEDKKPGDHIDKALALIPIILNLKTLDSVLHGKSERHFMILRYCVSFGSLLQRPWYGRQWVIQVVACAQRLSVRLGKRIISW